MEESDVSEEMQNDKCEKSRRPYTIPDLESGQCDMYIECERGQATSKLCEDGLVYHVTDNICDMPQRVDCRGRERLQPARGHGNCPRLNGIFPSTEYCDQYYFCRAGIPLMVTCAAGLVYDVKVCNL